MPKVKYGRRHLSDRRKRCERLWQDRVKLDDITNTRAECTSALAGDFFSQLHTESISIPSSLSNWLVHRDANHIEFLLLKSGSETNPSAIKFSVVLHKSLEFTIRVFGKQIHSGVTIFQGLDHIQSCQDLEVICTGLQNANICRGNDDESFMEILENKPDKVIRNLIVKGCCCIH